MKYFPKQIRNLCLVALTAMLAATATRAQEPEQVLSREDLNIYSQAELVVRYHKMSSADALAALRLISRLYGRKLYVETEGGSPRRVDNLYELNDMIVIYDTVKEIEKIVDALDEVDAVLAAAEAKRTMEREIKEREQFEREQAQSRSRGLGIVSRTYTPRFVGAVALGAALTPLSREFQVHEEDGSWHMTKNLRASDSPSVLLIRDTEANVKMIMDRILEIDQPMPQVMLAAYLISPAGFYENSGRAELPKELTENLALLTPYKEFDMLATSSIRTNVSSRGETQLVLHRPSGKYGLALGGLTYDDKSRSLSVGSALLRRTYVQTNESTGGQHSFEKVDVALQTSFNATEGEYAVIGISEEDGAPMLLAITFKSIPRPKVN